MKNKMKLLSALIVCSLPLLSAQAQMQLPTQNNGVQTGTPAVVGEGNTYEKEVTPLLRDISKKKSMLELRRLDRELDKLDEEALTAKAERDKILNPPTTNVNPNSPNFGMAGAPQVFNPNSLPAPVAHEEDTIRVLMVYGSDNDLYAKVSNGSQGGYVVRKGDILPDGRLVTNITQNFIEVKKDSKKKVKGVDKLYVLGPAPTGNNAKVATAAPSSPGSAMLPPMAAPNPNIPQGAVVVPSTGPMTLPVGAAPARR